MPPEKAVRGQFRLASIRASTEYLWSPIGRPTPILSRGATVLLEDDIHDEDDHDDEEFNADIDDALSDGLGDNLSDVLEDNPSAPEPITQPEFVSMR